jgi:hypothetical protein
MLVRRILADPAFLFRTEAEPADVPSGAAYRVGDIELGIATVVLPLEQHSR